MQANSDNRALTLAGQTEHHGERSPTWLRCLSIIGRSHGLNLTVTQLIKDNLLSQENVTVQELIGCANQSGLKAKLVLLDWDDLRHLKKALPVIIKLKTGAGMILTDVRTGEALRPSDEQSGGVPHVFLRDPDAEEGSSITIDRVRLEEIWTGEVVLVRRDYKLSDEEKPFGWPFVFTLFMRERRIVRDLVLGAFMLAVLALSPMLFWRF